MAFEIDFGGAEYDRGSDAKPKLNFVGLVSAEVTSVEETKSGSGNDCYKITMKIVDSDANGIEVKKTVPVSGKDKRGEPNAKQLLRVLDSLYSFKLGDDEKALNKVKEVAKKKPSSKAIMDALKGAKLAFEVGFREFQGDNGQAFACEAIRWVLAGVYNEAASTKSADFRKPLPSNVQAWRESNKTRARRGDVGAAPAAAESGSNGAAASQDAMDLLG